MSSSLGVAGRALGTAAACALIAACDPPIRDTGQIPTGRYEVVQFQQAVPVDTFGPGPTGSIDPSNGCACPQPANPCLYAYCDASGYCQTAPVADNTGCNADGSACTVGDS